MEINRFELEQQILKCWNTSDDIEAIYRRVVDYGLSGDELTNALLGVMSLHTIRSQDLFEIFEKMVGEGLIK